MKKRILKVYILTEEKGYGAQCTDISDISMFVIGSTLDEVKQEMLDLIKEVREDGDSSLPSWFVQGDFVVEWSLSVQSFLTVYGDILTQTGLAKKMGVNQSLLAQYKTGAKKPRKKQVEKIQEAVHQLAKELLSIPLSV